MDESRSMMRESAVLSVFSVALQGLGLLFNIFLTRSLGAASVGVLTLMGSFYSLAAVLSGGSGFLSASRFVSEALGCGDDPKRVFRYALRFSMLLSGAACVLLCLTTPLTVPLLHKTGATALTVRLLSLCLPLSALGACLKGRCYAYRRVYVPAIAECAEFLLRAGVMAFCAVFLIPAGRLTILSAFAVSMLAGQGSAALLLLCFRMPKNPSCGCTLHFGSFLRAVLPMIGNASLVALLSSANDALVPLTLRQYGNSTQEALSQFGEFEAIIIPTLFFPSVVQCCMAGLLVPELSQARAAKNSTLIRQTTERVLGQTVAYALPVVLIMALFGGQIGVLLGGDPFTGKILRLMAPVIPFIYLEIILEGVLRGLGRQSFSSVNYLAEYTVRISVLLICVPLFGFYGIVASYMACNLSGNAVRLFFVLRLTGLKPSWKRILLRPAFCLLLSWQLTALAMLPLKGLLSGELLYMTVFTVLCGAAYLFLLGVTARLISDRGAHSDSALPYPARAQSPARDIG